MIQKLVWAVAFSVLLSVAGNCSAVTLSRNNPYRSFNVSGYNYGSTQWQKSHRKSTNSWSTGNHSRRLLFRR